MGGITRKALFLAALSLLIWGSFTDALALDPKKAITQYVHDVWNDQLPQNTIHAIVQTRDGYIWFGTYEGLVRFDGVRFTVLDRRNTEGLKSNGILSLFEDRAGALWIGTVNGGLSCLREGTFTNYSSKDGLPDAPIITIQEDSQRDLWIGTQDGGLCLFKNGKFTTYTKKDGLPDNDVRALYLDRQDNLWIGVRGSLCLFKDNKFIAYTLKDGLSSEHLWAIYEDRRGNLWISTDTGLNRFSNGKFTVVYTNKDGLTSDQTWTIYEDKDGNLWVGTSGAGINRIRDGKITTFTSKDGLSNNTIRSIYEDREGSLWIGTNTGLNRLRDGTFLNYTTREGLSNDFVRTIYEDSAGNVWLGSDGGGLCRFKDGQFTTYTAKDGLLQDYVRTVYEDRSGKLWIGTNGGICSFNDGRFTRYDAIEGYPAGGIRAILEDRAGNLWVGTSRAGLFLYKENKFTPYTDANGLSNNEARAIYEDRDGDLWIGTNNGLNRFRNGKFVTYTTKDGLSSNVIFVIYQDKDGDLWIGTNGGLNRFKDGKFYTYTVKDGLYDDIAFQILEDEEGNFWVSCNRGIFRVNKKEFDDFSNGKIKTIRSVGFNKADGMRASQCNGSSQPAGWKSRDGKLWFPTVKGAVVIDPFNIRTNQISPPVAIEQVIVDGESINLRERVDLKPGKEKFEFHYSGLSFLFPEKVYFKYKLEGFEEKWEEAGTRRTAYYNSIPPGDYRFKVIACNNDGLWNEIGADYSFHIMTPLWKTRTAYFFYLILITGLIYGIVQLRIQSLRRRNKMLEAKIAERTTELAEKMELLEQSERSALEANRAKSVFLANMSHELRTPLNAIIGFAQILGGKKGFKEEDYKQVSIITRSGEHLLGLINDVLSISKIEAGKLILKQELFDPHQLIHDLTSIFQSRAESKGLEFICELDPALPKHMRGDAGKLRQVLINLLNNALKFTTAGSIILRVQWRDGRVCFEVEDTGYGIEAKELNKLFEPFIQTESGQQAIEGTGLGLYISRNIIRSMNGDITVSSELGRGTLFRFEIELPIASELQIHARRRRVRGLAPGQPEYRILIVDDRLENRSVLEALLSSVGLKSREATNGKEAVEIWREWQPHLIWMDMRMRVMDGYTATQIIRRESAQMQSKKNNGVAALTPVVIISLTASAFEQDHERIYAAGCDDIVTKPFNDATIFEKLTEHLGIGFEYEESLEEKRSDESQSRNAQLDIAAELATIPTDLTEKLYRAIIGGKPVVAQQIIDLIERENELLAAKLRDMVKCYRLSELMHLLKKI